MFLKNLETGEIALVNKSAEGVQGKGFAFGFSSISADGRFVAFRSNANNLIVGESIGGLFLADADGMNAPSRPGNTDYAIYSDTAAEVFWDRVSNNGSYLYEITRNGDLVGVLDTLSVFDDDLQPGIPYTYSVTPIDSNDNRLAAATVSFTTGHIEPSAPGNLRYLVYSNTAAELFWDRPTTFGLVYQIIRDGKIVLETDAVSYFDDSLSRGPTFRYEIVTIDLAGNRSAAAMISVNTDPLTPVIKPDN